MVNRQSSIVNRTSSIVNPKSLSLLLPILLLTFTSQAQIRCGTDILEKKALEINPRQRVEFEMWMKDKIRERSRNLSNAKTNATYLIPVVVHILHNGEAVGTGTNIPDAQVQSQIKVLNEDYQRMNADAANTPAEFAPLASSINIEFILAKQDPDGLPTNGITRTLASKNGYTIQDNVEIKAQAYWPAEDYLNIWVVNLTDTRLGFAQFPQTTLMGPAPPYDRTTDGVVIHYKAFGSKADGPFDVLTRYSKGRTATHEVGHFFSLLHTFGDGGNCQTTDYVDDTPSQMTETLSCPSAPINQCGHHIMFQNFLDYTDDECMNMFTQGQISRMITVLENSPRRKSLNNSHGTLDPVVLTLDLEAKSIIAPLAQTCGQSIVPKVAVRNRGTTTVTSTRINLVVNGTTIESKDFSVNLNQLDQATLSFSAINLPEPSTNNVSFTIVQVNGVADNAAGNNTATVSAQVTPPITLPVIETFNTLPASWTIVNPDNATTWENVTAPKSTESNRAMFVDMFNYESTNAKDRLVSPYFSIPDDQARLKFDRAYAVFQNVTNETLRVFVSTGCSADIADAVQVYSKSGTSLATTTPKVIPFTPGGESQWSSDVVALTAYAGQIIQIIFESTNAHGNNLYIDNVQLNSGETHDISVLSVVSPGPVVCDQRPAPVIEVQNLGTTTINSLSVTTEVNGTTTASQTLTGLAMTPGAQSTLTLQALNFSQSINNIKITVADPDAVVDDVPDNNTLSFTRVFNTAAESIPIRQNFDEDQANWVTFSQGSAKKWEPTSTNSYQNGVVFKGFINGTPGDESWLVSPVLDFTRSSEGSLHFMTSYARKGNSDDRLRVLVSEDCGVHYDKVIFDKSGEDLSIQTSGTEWKPTNSNQWRSEYVSTNDFAGKSNIRFAFVATNGNGNNIYLDNIEFFVEDTDEPPVSPDFISIYNSEFNPYEFFLTFSLPVKEDARLIVYNTIGQVVIDCQLPGTLNQTYTVDLTGKGTGVYVARLETPTRRAIAKLFVGK